MAHFNKNPVAEDYRIRSERLCVPISIVHHATPASKTYASDLPGCLILSLEGLTAASTAADSGCSFTTPVDSTGIFGVLLYNLGTVSKLHKYEVVNLSSGTCTVTAVGASSTGVTASGNIAISVDWNGSLASTDLTALVCVDYIISKA